MSELEDWVEWRTEKEPNLLYIRRWEKERLERVHKAAEQLYTPELVLLREIRDLLRKVAADLGKGVDGDG